MACYKLKKKKKKSQKQSVVKSEHSYTYLKFPLPSFVIIKIKQLSSLVNEG